MPVTPLERLVDRLRAPMTERGFALRKRPLPTFHRDATDDRLSIVLEGRGKHGRWHVSPWVRVSLRDVERWCEARGIETRGCELQWVVPQEELRASLPRPSSLAWASGLDLVDATDDVPPPGELAARGQTVSDFLHSDARLDEAAQTLLRVVDVFAARCLEDTRSDTLRGWLAEPELVALRAHMPAWHSEVAWIVVMACVRAPDLTDAVTRQLRAQLSVVDATVAAPALASLERIDRSR